MKKIPSKKRAERAARLLFLIQPIILLIRGVIVVVDVVFQQQQQLTTKDQEAHKESSLTCYLPRTAINKIMNGRPREHSILCYIYMKND